LVALSQPAFDRFAPKIKKSGLIFADSFYVHTDCKDVVLIPFSETARNEIGREVVTNVVMLGALAAATDIVRLESLKKALRHRVRSVFLDLNLRAVDAGYKLGKEIWKKRSS
jgi:2-oxoglutarate ferredoxin oxidoreductase subunit gamma